MVSTRIEERLGVYKLFDKIPPEYRLETFSAGFQDRDVWTEWNAIHSDTEWKRTEARRVKDRWDEHMDDRDRHYALARPADIESFVSGMLEDIQVERAYKPYWLFLKRFYHWLMWNTEYPHRYNPVLLATANYPACGKVWEHVMSFDRRSFG